MPTLTIQLPGLPPVDHILRDESMTIGRMKGNTIALDDASVSLSHAKITRKDSDFYLKDLNSTNGTMLNGQTIVEARLRDGDQIKFGEVIAHYRSEPAFVAGVSPSGTATAQQPAPQAPATAPSSSPPPPPSAPTASTSFVSKRLVTQATTLTQNPSAAPLPPEPAATSSRNTRRFKKGKSPPLVPVIGAAAALVVLGILGWIFFGKESTPNSQPPATPASVKRNPPDNQSASAPKTKPPANEDAGNQSLVELKKSLKSPDAEQRRKAAAALYSLGSVAKDAVPELRDTLKDSDADVRMWSALALINNKSYDKATIPILLQILHHENSMLRQVSCLSLALIPYDEAEKQNVVTALIEVSTKDSDEEVRKVAISALKMIAPDAVPADK